jgi:hypothetical protein
MRLGLIERAAREAREMLSVSAAINARQSKAKILTPDVAGVIGAVQNGHVTRFADHGAQMKQAGEQARIAGEAQMTDLFNMTGELHAVLAAKDGPSAAEEG